MPRATEIRTRRRLLSRLARARWVRALTALRHHRSPGSHRSPAPMGAWGLPDGCFGRLSEAERVRLVRFTFDSQFDDPPLRSG